MTLTQAEADCADALIRLALAEDLSTTGDRTSLSTIPEATVGRAAFVARTAGVVAGLPVADRVCRAVSTQLTFAPAVEDGTATTRGLVLATVSGPLRAILTAERTALNFLQRLSGVATLTRKFVDAASGFRAKILDTRKTTPGWRLLEKYAVRAGGGANHRIGLYDGILIKDNHLAELGKDFPAKLRHVVEEARNVKGLKFVAVEVDHVDDQLNHVLKIPGIDIVLLDNMGQWQLKHAVEMRDEMCGKGKGPLLEASGNITLNNVSEIAQCGVDRIAVGAITHSAAAVDIGLDR
jgi:nicotinate-nucleotide pyrophosphorylase (carboxylating)